MADPIMNFIELLSCSKFSYFGNVREMLLIDGRNPPWGKFTIRELDMDGKKVWEETRHTMKDAMSRLSVRKRHRPRVNTFIIIDDHGEIYVDF